MPRHTFFTENIGNTGSTVELDRDQKHHLFKVFRAVPGDEVELLNGKGVKAIGIIDSMKNILITEFSTLPVPETKLHLVFAIPRKNQLDLLLKQSCELGVTELHPVHFTRSVSLGEKSDRWITLLEEACKQSKNPFLPEIHKTSSLQEKLDELKTENIPLFFGAIRSASGNSTAKKEAAWIVGPEGGFTPEEEDLMKAYGAAPLNLGPWVLRLETAACAGIAVLRQMLGAIMLALLFCSCAPDPAKDPFFKKAERAVSSGDHTFALSFYRKAANRHPSYPDTYLKMANLCDESLDDPAAALFYYGEFLKLAPANHPAITTAQTCRELVKRRMFRSIIKENPDEQLEKLRRENAYLRKNNQLLANMLKNAQKSNQEKSGTVQKKSKSKPGKASLKKRKK